MIKPLDISKVTLEAKKASETAVKGLTFTNEAGTKVKMKPFKGTKGDYVIKGATETSVIIEGQGNCTGEGLVPKK